MTQHLTPKEFIEALDGELLAARRSHLESCDGCRDEVDHLRQLMTDVGATAAIPEPSPLFWEHFSRRVRAATGEMVAGPAPWWHIGWRPFMAVGGVLAAVVLTVALQLAPESRLAESRGADVAALTAPDTDAGEPDSLDFVGQLAATMSYDAVQQATGPTVDGTDAALESLTPQQRAVLARLLNAQIRGVE